MSRKGIIITASFSADVLELMDEMRGDLPRSRYIARLVKEDKLRQEKQKQFENVMKGFMKDYPGLAESLLRKGVEAGNEACDSIGDEKLKAWGRGDFGEN